MIAATLRAPRPLSKWGPFAGPFAEKHGKPGISSKCVPVARERKITTASGTIAIKLPRVNDERVGEDGKRQRLRSRLLPAYTRRSPKVAEVDPGSAGGA